MTSITLEESKDMDILLEGVLAVNKKYGDSSVTDISYLHAKFLSSRDRYYVTELVYKILDQTPRVIISEERSGIRTKISATKVLEDFLKTGGFTKIVASSNQQKEQDLELKRLTLEKTKIDLANSKRIFRTYWWTFSFSIIALIISVLLLFMKIFEK